MAEPEVDIDDDDVGDIAIPAGPSTSKFFETVQDDFTELTFTDFSHLDEPVPGESDDDDDTRSIAARRLKGRRQRKKNHRRIVVSLCSCKYPEATKPNLLELSSMDMEKSTSVLCKLLSWPFMAYTNCGWVHS